MLLRSCCLIAEIIKKYQLSSIFQLGEIRLYKSSRTDYFLVGAFSFKEKSPTITVASFFSFFFRQTTELIAYVPLFTETDKTTQANEGNSVQRVPPSIFFTFFT